MSKFIPYGRQELDQDDVAAVVEVLNSDFLTTGPKIEEFEKAFADFVGAKHAVAVSNGTAALHATAFALGVGPGDEVIVPSMTFAASANAFVFQGAVPVFADVEEDTLLVNPAEVEAKITERTRAVVGVDFAGLPADWDALRAIAEKHGLSLVADAAHAVGAEYHGRSAGTLARLSAFSFHPVKHFTTGEGGMVTTDDGELATRMRRFRNHGISADYRSREEKGTWFYEMTDLGYNYRLTDIQCALGLSQLKKLPAWIENRRAVATRYEAAFSGVPGIETQHVPAGRKHAYHIFVVRLAGRGPEFRAEVFGKLRDAGIGVNVHYIPVHLHPYYRETFGTAEGLCPVAEKAYEELITLPLYAGLTAEQADYVADTLVKAIE